MPENDGPNISYCGVNLTILPRYPTTGFSLIAWFMRQSLPLAAVSGEVKPMGITKRDRSSKPLRSAGARLRAALKTERPLQVVGVVHAYAALLAEKSGFKALYLSGAGVANASYGMPDVGITTLDNVLLDVRRIAAATQLPLLVDVDTGWGNPQKTVREMIKAGAGGIHIEDQVEAKLCGHLAGKKLVPAAEMVRRI